MSLHCKLVLVQYREYENGLFRKLFFVNSDMQFLRDTWRICIILNDTELFWDRSLTNG